MSFSKPYQVVLSPKSNQMASVQQKPGTPDASMLRRSHSFGNSDI